MTNEQTKAAQTPYEQIRRFVDEHSGEWQEVPSENPSYESFVLDVYPYRITVEAYYSAFGGSLEHVNHDVTFCLDPCPLDASLLTQIAWRGADAIQAHDGSVDDLPLWLRDPVRRILRTRAGELHTLSGAPTISPEISPDSQALKDARAVLKATSNPTILPTDLTEIGIITDRHGICVTINKGAYRLFTSRRVKPDQLVEALEDAAKFAELGMPYDDGCMAAMSVRNWMARLSVVADLRRILGVTV